MLDLWILVVSRPTENHFAGRYDQAASKVNPVVTDVLQSICREILSLSKILLPGTRLEGTPERNLSNPFVLKKVCKSSESGPWRKL